MKHLLSFNDLVDDFPVFEIRRVLEEYRFDGDVLGLYDYLGEYENLDELNHLACLLSELPQSEIEKFEAALHMGAHTSSVADIINLAENLDINSRRHNELISQRNQ